MTFDALAGVLLIPALAACLLAALPGYRLTSRLNVLATFLTCATAVSLFVVEPSSGPYLLVDDLNKVFIVLTTFVSFTTSVFSASYIGHEIKIGRLKPTYVRFYHAMYQVLMFGMNLALIANNIGLMWVPNEMATQTPVRMVGIYRTHEALEAAWKYFILGSVGIALALFGTILVYMAARPVIGEGIDAMVWTVLVTRAAKVEPALLNVAFVFLLLGYGTKVGLAPLHAWLTDAHAEGPTPISAVLSGLLLNVALYALLRFKICSRPTRRIAPGPADGDVGADLAAVRRVHDLPATRHQAHVCLFLDRAHGHHHLRLRARRTDRELRRAAAHGHAQPDQVRDLRRRHVPSSRARSDRRSGASPSQPCSAGLVAGVAIAGLPPLGVHDSSWSSTFARSRCLRHFVFGCCWPSAHCSPQSVAFANRAYGPSDASYSDVCASRPVIVTGIFPPPIGLVQHVAQLLDRTKR